MTNGVDRMDYVEEKLRPEAGRNISWRSVFAGLATFISLVLLSSLLGAAIGLGTPDFTSPQPLAGVGTGLVWWIVLTLIVALAAAGFVAGYTANRSGVVHGFLTWAVSVIALFWLTFMLVSAGASLAGQAIGAAGSAVGSAAQTAGDALGGITEDLEVDVNTDALGNEVTSALQDTDIEQLQPEYLQGQLQAAAGDIRDAGYAIIVQGQDPQQVVEDTGAALEERVTNITEGIDREELEAEIAQNSDLSEAEVSEAADNIEQAYNEASQQVTETIQTAQTEFNQFTDQVAQTSEEASNTAAQYSLYIFGGLLVGLIITALAGRFGVQRVLDQDDDDDIDRTRRIDVDRGPSVDRNIDVDRDVTRGPDVDRNIDVDRDINR